MTADDTDVSPPGDETVASMSHGAGGDETEVVGPDSGDVDRQALRAYLAGRAAGARAAAARGRTVDTALSGATTASPRGADAPTVVVPPATVDAAGLAWSLDDADDDDSSPVEPQSWRLTLGYTAVLVSIAFVVALVVGVVGWVVFVLPEAPPRPGDPAYIPPPLPPSSIGPWTTPNAVTPSPVAVPPPSTVTVTAVPPATVTVQAAPSPAAAAPLPPPAPPTTVTVQAAPPPAPTVAPVPRDSDRIFREGVSGIPGMHIVNWDVAEAGARSICGGFAHGMTRAQVVDEVQRNDPTFTTWQTSGMVNVALAAYCPQYEGN